MGVHTDLIITLIHKWMGNVHFCVHVITHYLDSFWSSFGEVL
jgi:hypothetical protein